MLLLVLLLVASARGHGNRGGCLALVVASLHIHLSFFLLLFSLEIDFFLLLVLVPFVVTSGHQGRGLLSVGGVALLLDLDLLGEGGGGLVDDGLHCLIDSSSVERGRGGVQGSG